MEMAGAQSWRSARCSVARDTRGCLHTFLEEWSSQGSRTLDSKCGPGTCWKRSLGPTQRLLSQTLGSNKIPGDLHITVVNSS